jgi:hypothetical protein
MQDNEQTANPFNRRKSENRWRRILRDAEWDQYEPVRRWLKFAKNVLNTNDDDDDNIRPNKAA